MKKLLGLVISLVSIIGLCFVTSAAAGDSCTADIYDPSAPGSVLVFPKGVDGSTCTGPLTEFEVSVVCPDPEHCLCSEFGTVRLKATWVCPGKGWLNICSKTDFHLFTCDDRPDHRVGSTTKYAIWSAATPGTVPIPTPPCKTGFLVVWAIDDYGKPIPFDGLKGKATVRVSSGASGFYYAVRATYS